MRTKEEEEEEKEEEGKEEESGGREREKKKRRKRKRRRRGSNSRGLSPLDDFIRDRIQEIAISGIQVQPLNHSGTPTGSNSSRARNRHMKARRPPSRPLVCSYAVSEGVERADVYRESLSLHAARAALDAAIGRGADALGAAAAASPHQARHVPANHSDSPPHTRSHRDTDIFYARAIAAWAASAGGLLGHRPRSSSRTQRQRRPHARCLPNGPLE